MSFSFLFYLDNPFIFLSSLDKCLWFTLQLRLSTIPELYIIIVGENTDNNVFFDSCSFLDMAFTPFLFKWISAALWPKSRLCGLLVLLTQSKIWD